VSGLEIIHRARGWFIRHNGDSVGPFDFLDDIKKNLPDISARLGIDAKKVWKEIFDLKVTAWTPDTDEEEESEIQSIFIPREVNSDLLNCKIKVEGVVVSQTLTMRKIKASRWICPMCGASTTVEHDPYDLYDAPNKRTTPFCNSLDHKYKVPMQLDPKGGEFVDFVKIRLRDPFEAVLGLPEEINVHLVGNLARGGKVTPGAKVIIEGKYVAKASWGKGISYDYIMGERVYGASRELVLAEEDEKQVREWLKKVTVEGIPNVLFPRIHGHKEIKEAIVYWLTSFGAYVKGSEGLRRLWLHILIVGDPGTVKSVVFNRLINIFERYGLLTKASGSGATDVGLTASAIKDEEGQWSLIAGPLVLMNDKGLLIDEFDKAKREFSTLTIALEGEVNVDKAGIHATLPSRTACLVAQNPVGGYFNPNLRLVDQVKIPLPLIDRFDLIFPILDEPTPNDDRRISVYVIERTLTNEEEEESEEDIILAKYFMLANRIYKENVRRGIDPKLQKKITDYYLKLREGKKETPQDIMDKYGRPLPGVTARAVEVLIRLSLASAACRLSDKVTEEDIENGYKLYTSSLRATLFDPVEGKIKPLFEPREARAADILFNVLTPEYQSVGELWEKARKLPGLTPADFEALLGYSPRMRENWKLRKAIDELKSRPKVEVMYGSPLKIRRVRENEDLTDASKLRIRVIETVRELEHGKYAYEGAARKFDVLNMLQAEGYERMDVLKMINQLVDEGALYEPKVGLLKIVLV